MTQSTLNRKIGYCKGKNVGMDSDSIFFTMSGILKRDGYTMVTRMNNYGRFTKGSEELIIDLPDTPRREYN